MLKLYDVCLCVIGKIQEGKSGGRNQREMIVISEQQSFFYTIL